MNQKVNEEVKEEKMNYKDYLRKYGSLGGILPNETEEDKDTNEGAEQTSQYTPKDFYKEEEPFSRNQVRATDHSPKTSYLETDTNPLGYS